MVYECLKAWRLRNILLMNNTKVILHTSCVNYKFEDLKNMFSLEFDFVIPEDVFFELRLLVKSRVFGVKSAFILEKAKLLTGYSGWELSSVYHTNFTEIRNSVFFNNSLIFIFGDLNKTDEFLKHATGGEKMYIFLPPSTWSCTSGNGVIMDLLKIKQYQLRHAHALVKGEKVEKLSKTPFVYKNGNKETVITRDQFVSTGKYGSNADIYTCHSIPGAYIKGYKSLSMVGTQKKKLQFLQKFGAMVPNMNCAFPIVLLHNQSTSVVGYSMKKINGRLLREYLALGWEGHNLGKIFENLMMLLLELHTMHIIVNDLSYNNILIDDFDNVGLVDCDSFQIVNYPGGGITKIYQHPEIENSEVSHQLREPRHEYFALAVVLFQCLFGDEPLRQVQDASDENELNWENASFPLKIDSYSPVANKKIQEIWFKQPRELRKAFFEEFTFQRDISIGSWIRILGIID